MTQLATTQVSPIATTSTEIMMNPVQMRAMLEFANMMAGAVVTVPKHLQGKPADCLAISMQSARWKMDPFAVAQKTHLVNGTLGYEAQLVNAVIQSSGAIRGAFKYEYRGDGNALECRVGAILAGENEITWGEWLKLADVTTKNSPLWKTNPKQQMGYLQVKNWGRLYCPGAILGVYTVDELLDSTPPAETKDMGSAQEVSTPRSEPTAYPDDQFKKNLPAWKKLIEDGKKTPDQIIATVQSKATLSEDQKSQIRACAPATVIDNETGEVQQQAVAQPHPLAAAMDKAENEDVLAELADQIRAIDNEEVAQSLRKTYEANLYRLTKG